LSDDGSRQDSIGRRLANALHLPFIDADVEIEKAPTRAFRRSCAITASRTFAMANGGSWRGLLLSGPAVLATGGGAFMNEERGPNAESMA
jgi:shikimate kinase